MNAKGNRLAGGLLAGDTLNVDLVLETVDAGDLALPALKAAADNQNLVVLSINQLDTSGSNWPCFDVFAYRTGMLRTLYFSRSSLLRGALMMLRRMELGAWKWARLALRRDDETLGLVFILTAVLGGWLVDGGGKVRVKKKG